MSASPMEEISRRIDSLGEAIHCCRTIRRAIEGELPVPIAETACIGVEDDLNGLQDKISVALERLHAEYVRLEEKSAEREGGR